VYTGLLGSISSTFETHHGGRNGGVHENVALVGQGRFASGGSRNCGFTDGAGA
jgi:hypothetical protein